MSNGYTEQAHGLFTYFLLKGLGGAAGRDGDGPLRLSELADYVKDQVDQVSRRLFGESQQQTPVLQPLDPARDVLLRGR